MYDQGDVLSPVATAAAPISATAEQQHENNDNKQQRHGDLLKLVVIKQHSGWP